MALIDTNEKSVIVLVALLAGDKVTLNGTEYTSTLIRINSDGTLANPVYPEDHATLEDFINLCNRITDEELAKITYEVVYRERLEQWYHNAQNLLDTLFSNLTDKPQMIYFNKPYICESEFVSAVERIKVMTFTVAGYLYDPEQYAVARAGWNRGWSAWWIDKP